MGRNNNAIAKKIKNRVKRRDPKREQIATRLRKTSFAKGVFRDRRNSKQHLIIRKKGREIAKPTELVG